MSLNILAEDRFTRGQLRVQVLPVLVSVKSEGMKNKFFEHHCVSISMCDVRCARYWDNPDRQNGYMMMSDE